MVTNQLRLTAAPIQFGTDGWRGVLGVDVTLERLLKVACAASQELLYRASTSLKSRTIIIGYDRRFLAPEFAEAVASAVRGCELEPLLTQTPVPTPACSWAVVQRKALGALVITASHNPPEWLGLKIKGPLGDSVEGDFTHAVEKRLSVGGVTTPVRAISTEIFDGRKEHLDGLRRKFDLPGLANGLNALGIKVIVDSMHGSAAGCMAELLGTRTVQVDEIRSERDPLFGGNPPEPLAPYLSQLMDSVKAAANKGETALGLVFDGDGDRLAAVDEFGNFCSTQLLIPLLIDHLARVRKQPGCVVKTVSGSDLIRLVAEDFEREVIELPVGFKYIAAKMLSNQVLIGGEESGGIGFGGHLPERDALYASLLLLEALVEGGEPLGARLDRLKKNFGTSYFDRIDIRLANMDSRKRLEALLEETPPDSIDGKLVKEVIFTDGVKLRIDVRYWVMFRFSGTEPLLRIYCEAPTQQEVQASLFWAKQFAELA